MSGSLCYGIFFVDGYPEAQFEITIHTADAIEPGADRDAAFSAPKSVSLTVNLYQNGKRLALGGRKAVSVQE